MGQCERYDQISVNSSASTNKGLIRITESTKLEETFKIIESNPLRSREEKVWRKSLETDYKRKQMNENER